MSMKILKIESSNSIRFKHRWSFLNVGENLWGLRDWYSVDDIEEKSHQQFKNSIF